MAILTVNNISKSFGVDEIFRDVSFQIQPGEKVGLVGLNGTGKSTILRAILAASGGVPSVEPTDINLADTGDISFQRGTTLAYLRQAPEFPDGLTLLAATREAAAELLAMRAELEELTAAMSRPEVHDDPARLAEYMDRYTSLSEEFERREGYQVESRIRGVLIGLGFSAAQFDQTLSSMSGGERTRAELARILLKHPDILFLDEPTNHLDVGATEWLEDFLSAYSGATLIVSHDRFFLDRVVSRILELAHGRLKSFPGNYSAYQSQRDQEALTQARAYERQQEVIRREEAFIRGAKATEKAKKTAHSREKRLAMLERVERPLSDKEVRIGFEVLHRSGNRVVEGNGVAKGFGGRKLLAGADFKIGYRDRIGIVGPNGAGKTTLLRMIVGLEPPDAGSIRLGAGVIVGYFDQLHQGLDYGKSPVEEIIDAKRMTQLEARNLLGRYLFSGEDVFRPIGELSGGERSRVAIAKITLAKANLLILDEPTNHLDLGAIEALEEALLEYPGTLVIVSHDRYFVKRICTRIFEVKDGGVAVFEGGYQGYLDAKGPSGAGVASVSATAAKPDRETSAAPSEAASKPLSKHQAALKAQRISRLEEEVQAAEARVAEMEAKLADPSLYDDYEQARELTASYEQAKSQLEGLLEEWLAAVGE